MQFTDREIVVMYQEAKRKDRQIHILAELNDCKTEDIKTILVRHKVLIPGKKVKEKPENEKVSVRQQALLPDEAAAVLYARLDELDGKIKELTQEYKAISRFLKGESVIQ